MQRFSMLVILMFTLFSNTVFAASVNKLFSKERFKIDAGSDLGVAKGDKICTYDENSEELACGSVFKVKSSISYVKVSPKESFSKVAAGQAVKIERNGEMVEITDTDTDDSAVEMASVSKMFSKQRFKINAGSDQGVSKNDYVCVYNESNKKVACGKVWKNKKTRSYVKIKSKTQFSRVKVGLTVRVKRGKSYEDILLESSSSSYSGQSFRIHLAYAPGIISPYQYNAVELPQIGEFAANDSTMFTALGGQISFEYMLNKSISFSLGVRYRSSPTDQVLTGSKTFFEENDTSASDIGVLVDAYLYTIDLKPVQIRFGTGIDYDMSTVTFTSTEVDETSATIEETFSATSNLSVLALRGLVDVRYPLGMFSFGLGLDLEIPIVALGDSTTVNSETAEEDLANFQEALGHTKSSFAVVL